MNYISFSQLNKQPNKLSKLLSDNKNLSGLSALKAGGPPSFNNTGRTFRNLGQIGHIQDTCLALKSKQLLERKNTEK